MRISDCRSDLCSSDHAASLTDQYGVDNLYVGVPVIIGKDGVEQVVEIELDDEAKANLQVSVDAVMERLEACKGIDPSLDCSARPCTGPYQVRAPPGQVRL